MLAAGPAAGGLRRDHGQFRAEVVQMQEGHGPSDRPEPEGDGGTLPGASWVPWAEPTPEPSDQPSPPGPGQPSSPSYGQPSQPGQPSYSPPGQGQPGREAYPGPSASWQSKEQETPAGPATTELGTWTMSAGGQGTWEPPPGGGHGGWGPPPAGGSGGYGQPGGGYGQPGGPRPERRRNHPLLYVLVAVVAAALGAGAVFALQAKSSSPSSSSSFSPQDVPSPASSPGSGNTNTSGIDEQSVATKVEPGLVDITASLRYTGQVFEGTGMVLSSSGLVLTNNHVVDGSTGLTATVVSSGRKYQAQIVGTDAKDDVALLRLTGVSGLKTVQVGDSSKVTRGSPVVALGNAGGAGGTPTVTSGSITALNRTITASDAGSGNSETLHNMLQTNAHIAEGDSGGPLANAAGQVIGMNTAANTQSFGPQGSNEGFAIPINHALALAHQMAAGNGSASIRIGQPAFMGIAVASSSSSAASSDDSPQQQLQQLNRTAGQFGGGINSNGRCLGNGAGNPVPASIAPASTGTLIAGAFCNAPAAAAGLTGGDVILDINGQTVGAPTSLTGVLAKYHPGDRVSVTWMDTSGQRHTSSVTLTTGPAK
jgi:S1-C subfamily serine protease